MTDAHPALTQASQIALTLRAVGGLTTAEIASAFLVPETTIGQRISRAKASIRDQGATFRMPDASDLPRRLRADHRVLYLIFNEGYLATSGEQVLRTDLSVEAIRLARLLHTATPADGDSAALLAVVLLTDARRAARLGPGGMPIPLAEQDRGLWNREVITEGTELAERAMTLGPLGPYHVQAAIAALHDQAATAEDTDWPQILALYTVLERLDPSPMVPLNRAVAVAMVHGPHAGLAALDALTGLDGHHRNAAVRAHLLELAGRHTEAVAQYRRAARLTLSIAERRYLTGRAQRLDRLTAGALLG